MKMKKLLISSLVGVSLLASAQSAFAATYSSAIETTDISNLEAEAMNLRLNEYFMGYISGPNSITNVNDYKDAFKWTNTTDHDIAIEVWLFSPIFSTPNGTKDTYNLNVRLDDQYFDYLAQKNGRYSYAIYNGWYQETDQQIIIKPGRSAFFQVWTPWLMNFSETKNYVIWVNEVPIKE